jgi:uncharacterized repeat protein (TIGR02543 family)
MKKILSLIILALMLASTLLLSSCGGFFSEAELTIKSITSEPQEDGSTKIIISYHDESINPTEFFIPPGKEGIEGKQGNGIREITYKYNPDTKKTDVVISYTDLTLPPVSFSVPDGLSVVGISENTDEITNEKYVIFNYSDGTSSQQIYIPSGKDGADGVGIKSYEVINNEDKSICLKLEFDDGRICQVDVPAPEKGNGIAQMVSRTEADAYYIDVIYDNGETTTLNFDRSNKWFKGTAKPSDADGINGDYFFDTANKVIYVKFDGSWIDVVDFETSIVSCKVQFDPNDNGDAIMNGDNFYFINRGEYFFSYGYTVPTVTREGYKFLGWYTEKVSSPSPTLGAFTNLTPVMSDLKLYAAWAPVD